MGEPFYSVKDGVVLVSVKAIPGASRNALGGLRGGELVVKVAAAPEKGKATEALLAFLARESGFPRSAFSLKSGETARHKVVRAPLGAIPWLEALGGVDTATPTVV